MLVNEMKEDALFYVGQKGFIRKGRDILVLGDPKEGLDFPGGKIQEGETDLHEALKREIREETTLEVNVGKPFATWINTFPDHHPLAGKKVYLVGYICDYVSGDVKLSDEHNTFHWVNKDNYHEVNDGSTFFNILKTYFEM